MSEARIEAAGEYLLLLPLTSPGEAASGLLIEGAGEIPSGTIHSVGHATPFGGGMAGRRAYYKPMSGLELRHEGITYIAVLAEDILAIA